MSYDAIVIGGGIVGMSAAYHLVSAGARTLLVDRMDKGRATDAGAGILSPATNTRDPDPWQRLASLAVEYYPGLIQNLTAEQAGETGFAVCGMMIVAVSDDELEPFDIARRRIFNRRSRRGEPSAEDLYEISSEEARSRFPALADVQGAIYYREAARVDGRLLTGALRRAAEARGLTIQQAGVESLRMDNDTVTGVLTDAGSISAAGVVIAGGAWSHAFGLQLGVRIPVEPQRGQIIHLGLPAGSGYVIVGNRQRRSRPLHGALAGQPGGRGRHAGNRIRFRRPRHGRRGEGSARRGAAGGARPGYSRNP